MTLRKMCTFWLMLVASSMASSMTSSMGYGKDKPFNVALAPRQESIVLEPWVIFRDCLNCPEMVVIPAGMFWIGDTPEEEIRNAVPRRHLGRAQPQNIGCHRKILCGRAY